MFHLLQMIFLVFQLIGLIFLAKRASAAHESLVDDFEDSDWMMEGY